MEREKLLIDANALMAYIHNHDYELVSRMGCVDKGMFTDGIEHGINIQPTVDAVEVVHGRWLWDTNDVYKCSNCGERNRVKEVMGMPDWDYCPNCGAKMDGVGNG